MLFHIIRPHRSTTYAIATIFGFLYMGCTLAPHEEKNTTEPSMCGGDAALCQITLTSCLHLFCDVRFLLSFFLSFFFAGRCCHQRWGL